MIEKRLEEDRRKR